MRKTSALSLKFAKLVEKNPCLYKSNSTDYSRKDITDQAWLTIATKMQWSVAYCKEKWRNMRSNFLRSYKGQRSGSTIKAKRIYYLHDKMQFLIPYVRPFQQTKGNNSNIMQCDPLLLQNSSTESDEIEDCSEDSSNNSVNKTKKRSSDVELHKQPKKTKKSADVDDKVADDVLQIVKAKREKGVSPDSDGRKMFLLSMLTDIEKMTEQEYADFRIYCLMGIRKFITNRTENSTSQYDMPSSSNSFVNTPAPSVNGMTETKKKSEIACDASGRNSTTATLASSSVEDPLHRESFIISDEKEEQIFFATRDKKKIFK